MRSSLLRRLILIPAVLLVVFEVIMWAFVRIPLDPLLHIDLSNRDLQGLKQDVALEFNRRMVRFDGWTAGEKPANTLRILCLGGSSTFAMLQNTPDTWWGQLRARLAAAGISAEMAAWGQDRAGIVVSAAVAREVVDELRPDIVIANFGFDDVIGQPVNYTYDPGKLGSMSYTRPESGVKTVLLKISQSVRLYRWWGRRNQSAGLQNQHGRPNHYTNLFKQWKEEVGKVPPSAGPVRVAPDDPLREVMDGWQALHDLCKQSGATLIMTGEASLHDSVMNSTQMENLTALIPETAEPKSPAIRPDPAWVEGEMNRFAASAEAFATKNEHPWLNLNGRISRTMDNFFNDAIFTDAGSATAADLLFAVVEPTARAGK